MEKIKAEYCKVDAGTVEDGLLDLQRAVEHARKTSLLKAGMKTQLARIEQFSCRRNKADF